MNISLKCYLARCDQFPYSVLNLFFIWRSFGLAWSDFDLQTNSWSERWGWSRAWYSVQRMYRSWALNSRCLCWRTVCRMLPVQSEHEYKHLHFQKLQYFTSFENNNYSFVLFTRGGDVCSFRLYRVFLIGITKITKGTFSSREMRCTGFIFCAAIISSTEFDSFLFLILKLFWVVACVAAMLLLDNKASQVQVARKILPMFQ